MNLANVRDFIKSFKIADNYYIGKLDSKKDRSVGVYQLNKRNTYFQAVGGKSNTKAKTKSVSILVHWNNNARETEAAAARLFAELEAVRNANVGDFVVCFIEMLNVEPIDVSTDENGIYERVIECVLHYE